MNTFSGSDVSLLCLSSDGDHLLGSLQHKIYFANYRQISLIRQNNNYHKRENANGLK